MKTNFFKNPLFLVLITCISSVVTAQTAATSLLYDDLVRLENTDIFNGREYIEKHRIINEKHKFFDSFDFVKGVVVYDGQTFYNVDLKYNILEDLLLVQLYGSRGKTRFGLHKEDLDGFTVSGHHFINLKGSQIQPFQKGIYEVLAAEDKLQLLKKHRLSMKKRLEKQLLYHEFEKSSPEYFFLYEGQLKPADPKGLADIFPEIRDEIKNFYRENRRLRRKEPQEFHNKLFSKISSLTRITTTN